MNSLRNRYRGWCGRVPSAEASDVWSWGTPSRCGCAHQPGPPLNPCSGGLWRLPHVSVISYQPHLQPLPSLEDSGGAENFGLLMRLVLLVTLPHRNTPPRVTPLEHRVRLMLSSLRKFQGLGSSVPGTEGRDKYFLLPHSIRI